VRDSGLLHHFHPHPPFFFLLQVFAIFWLCQYGRGRGRSGGVGRDDGKRNPVKGGRRR